MFPFFLQIDGVSPDFAVQLITELANAFLAAADAQVLNCCAFAIQDALATYDCVNSNPSRYTYSAHSLLYFCACVIWHCFPHIYTNKFMQKETAMQYVRVLQSI